MANFRFERLGLEDAFCIEYFSMCDQRGGFAKTFEKDIYNNAGINFNLNETFTSVSQKNVIRGLHFQTNNPQAKIVSVLQGKVWDVIVDVRKDSITFKKWIGVELSKQNHKALYIPRGFAHGFISLEDNTIMLYQCDGAYDVDTDTGIRFDDPDIGIEWPIYSGKTIHSQRDLEFSCLKDLINSSVL